MDGDLIPIRTGEIGGVQMDCVNLRDVWEFVESKQQFANWIQVRLISSELYMEGEDWVVNKISKNPQGGRPMIEYIAPLEVSKEIALGDQTKKAKLYRKWIIARELKLSKIETDKMDVSSFNFADPNFLAIISAGLMKRNEVLTQNVAKLEIIVAEKTPKANGFDQIANCEGLLGLRETAKLLGVNETVFFKKLHLMGWIYRSGSGPWKVYKDKERQGLVATKTFTHEVEGVEKIRYQAMLTAKGVTQLTLIFAAPKQKSLLDDAC